MERLRGKTSLLGRKKELGERARERRRGDCRKGRAGQRGGGRGSSKVREIPRRQRMRAENWVPGETQRDPAGMILVSQRNRYRVRRGEKQGV